MKSYLVAFRRRVCPRPQTTAADEIIGVFFEEGPVLDAMFLLTGDFGTHLFQNFFIAERTAKKTHDVGVAPQSSRQLEVIFFPRAKEEPAGTEDFHSKDYMQHFWSSQFRTSEILR